MVDMSCNILVFDFVGGGMTVFVGTGGEVDFVVMGRVNVVGATGFVGIGVATGFVCPNDNFPPVGFVDVVIEGAVLCSGGDILNALVVNVEDFPPKLVSNPPKAAVKSPNALPLPPPAPPPPPPPIILPPPLPTGVTTPA